MENREALSLRRKLTQRRRNREGRGAEWRTPSGFHYSGREVQARRGDRGAFIFGTFGDSVIDLYFSPLSSLNCLACTGFIYISCLGNKM